MPQELTWEEMEKRFGAVIDGRLKPITDRLDKVGGTTRPSSNMSFKIFDPGESATSVLAECPNCAFHDSIPKTLAIHEVEKRVEVPVPTVPDGYTKSPEDWAGIQAILDTKHGDGKTIWDCPKCSQGFQTLAEQHGYKKVK